MPSHDPDRDRPVEEKANQTLVQKVASLQERVRKMGVVSDGSDDKAFMDDAWDEQTNDSEQDLPSCMP